MCSDVMYILNVKKTLRPVFLLCRIIIMFIADNYRSTSMFRMIKKSAFEFYFMHVCFVLL